MKKMTKLYTNCMKKFHTLIVIFNFDEINKFFFSVYFYPIKYSSLAIHPDGESPAAD